MPVPTRQEINPYDDLDGRCASDHFYGKTLDEAVVMLRDAPLVYQEDLIWMGPVAFRYYLPAVARFVCTEPGYISDFVAHLASTLENRLLNEAEEMVPVAAQLVALCDQIVAQWPKFEEGTAAYGDVGVRYLSLREAFSRLIRSAQPDAPPNAGGADTPPASVS